MKRFTSSILCYAFILLSAIALTSHALAATRKYSGTRHGVVTTRVSGGVERAAAEDLARTLGFAVKSSRDELLVSGPVIGLKFVKGARTAWLGFDSKRLSSPTRHERGHWWVDNRDVLGLLSTLATRNGTRTNLHWDTAKQTPTNKASSPKRVQLAKLTTRHETSLPPVREVKTTESVPQSVAPPLPSLAALRWGMADDVTRAVIDLNGLSSPDVTMGGGVVTLAFSSIPDELRPGLRTAYPGVSVEAVENKLMFTMHGRSPKVFFLRDPFRCVIDFRPGNTAPEIAPQMFINPDGTERKEQPLSAVSSQLEPAELLPQRVPPTDEPVELKPISSSSSTRREVVTASRAEVKQPAHSPQKQVSATPAPPQSKPEPKALQKQQPTLRAPKNKPIDKKKSPSKRRAFVVALDPGHGGKDPGAMASGYSEKDIALQIARRIQTELQSRGVTVRMTRAGDTYPTLNDRRVMANEWKADAFLSIHLNALPKGRHASGTEFYIMAPSTDKYAMELAKIENEEIIEEQSKKGGKIDKRTSNLLRTLGDLGQNANIAESETFAESLVDGCERGGVSVSKVKQAPFYVLRGALMPAVLVETGYITEASDRARLTSASFQTRLARAVADGICAFRDKLK